MYNYPNKKNTKGQSGFSLIEIMVAISILMIVFISLMYAFPLGLSMTKGAESATIASYLAQEKIEELYSLGYSNINVGTIEIKNRLSNDQTNYLYGFQRKTQVDYVNGSLQVEPTNMGIKKISTTVYYIDAITKLEKSYNITALISER